MPHNVTNMTPPDPEPASAPAEPFPSGGSLAGAKLSQVVESSYTKIITRFVVPFIFLPAISWLITTGYAELRKVIEDSRLESRAGLAAAKRDMDGFRDKFWTVQAKMIEAQAALSTSLQVLSNKVESNKQRADEAAQRLQRDLDEVQRAMNTPEHASGIGHR